MLAMLGTAWKTPTVVNVPRINGTLEKLKMFDGVKTAQDIEGTEGVEAVDNIQDDSKFQDLEDDKDTLREVENVEAAESVLGEKGVQVPPLSTYSK